MPCKPQKQSSVAQFPGRHGRLASDGVKSCGLRWHRDRDAKGTFLRMHKKGGQEKDYGMPTLLTSGRDKQVEAECASE